MRNVKKSRISCLISGVMGIFMTMSGIAWTIIAAHISRYTALFGVIWTTIALVQTVVNFRNASSKKRPAAPDIADGHSAPSPRSRHTPPCPIGRRLPPTSGSSAPLRR